MKHLLLPLLFVFGLLCGWAQPKNASKALLRVTTYDAKGQQLQTGTAFLISADGVALGNYTLFQYAARAEAVDAKGVSHTVSQILGGSSMVDMVKFRIEGVKKGDFLPLATAPVNENATVYLLNNKDGKPATTATQVSKVAPFQNLKYYDLTAANDASLSGSPLVTADGRVFGIYQYNVGKEATTACAMDARFADSLAISATSTFNHDLRKIFIRKALPNDVTQARSYIYLQNPADSANYISLLNDFINTFPDNAEGFVDRANFFAGHGLYDKADADFNTALKLSAKSKAVYTEDEVRFARSKTIYNKILYVPTPEVAGWTLEQTLSEVRKAYSIRQLPIYKNQEGIYLFAQQDYKGAYDAFTAVNKTNLSSPETYYMAAQSLERLGTDSALLVATLDSMMAKCARPYNNDAAGYLLARAGFYNRMKRYRDAITDLNEYEKIIGTERLGPQFFYTREQIELSARQYQLALNDIQRAIKLAPDNTFFLIEEALIYLRAGEYEMALEKAEATLKLIPENPDCYKIIGISKGELGKKAEALTNLEKAKALGDDTVDTFIERYKSK